jgi:hypothetical protein
LANKNSDFCDWVFNKCLPLKKWKVKFCGAHPNEVCCTLLCMEWCVCARMSIKMCVLTWLGHMQHFHVLKISSCISLILNPLETSKLMLWEYRKDFQKIILGNFPGIQGLWTAHKNYIAEQVHRRLPHILNVVVFFCFFLSCEIPLVMKCLIV